MKVVLWVINQLLAFSSWKKKNYWKAAPIQLIAGLSVGYIGIKMWIGVPFISFPVPILQTAYAIMGMIFTFIGIALIVFSMKTGKPMH